MRLLIVEDEKNLCDIMKKYFTKENYSVDVCYSGTEALDYIFVTDYDGIILDIMLPGMDGLSVLRKIRKEGKMIPVLLLSAKESVEDKVLGLDMGADDYLSKPFSLEELSARVRVMTRRISNNLNNVLEIADLTLDRNTKIVTRNGKKISLSRKEYMVLEYLMKNQGIVLSRNQIAERAWNYEFEGESNIIDVYIRYLRKKIDEDFDNKLIHTVRGVGYVLREKESL